MGFSPHIIIKFIIPIVRRTHISAIRGLAYPTFGPQKWRFRLITPIVTQLLIDKLLICSIATPLMLFCNDRARYQESYRGANSPFFVQKFDIPRKYLPAAVCYVQVRAIHRRRRRNLISVNIPGWAFFVDGGQRNVTGGALRLVTCATLSAAGSHFVIPRPFGDA